LHQSITRPYVITGAGLYILDHIFRVCRTRATTATLVPLPDIASTHVIVPSLNSGWRAGQHVRLRVVPPNRGRWTGWITTFLFQRARPFTISTSGEDDCAGMELIVKKEGAWTGKLHNTAKGNGVKAKERVQYQLDRDVEGPPPSAHQVRILVEGPYSEWSHHVPLFMCVNVSDGRVIFQAVRETPSLRHSLVCC